MRVTFHLEGLVLLDLTKPLIATAHFVPCERHAPLLIVPRDLLVDPKLRRLTKKRARGAACPWDNPAKYSHIDLNGKECVIEGLGSHSLKWTRPDNPAVPAQGWHDLHWVLDTGFLAGLAGRPARFASPAAKITFSSVDIRSHEPKAAGMRKAKWTITAANGGQREQRLTGRLTVTAVLPEDKGQATLLLEDTATRAKSKVVLRSKKGVDSELALSNICVSEHRSRSGQYEMTDVLAYLKYMGVPKPQNVPLPWTKQELGEDPECRTADATHCPPAINPPPI